MPAQSTGIASLSADQKKHLYEELGIWETGFTIGVLNYTLTVITAFRFPQYYWILYLIKAFVYLPWRFVRFRRKNWEWLMADFCYFNVYFGVIGCLAAFIRITFGYVSPLHRYNYELIRGGFAFANGALALAVPLYNNKIVFHDVDNLASVFIHTSPAILLWTLRWGGGFGTSLIESTWPNMFDVCHDMQAGDAALANIRTMLWYSGPCDGDAWQFVVYPSICWLVIWGIPYYSIVLCLLAGYLARNKKETLYSFSVEDTAFPFGMLKKAPESVRPLCYMAMHFVFAVSSGFCSILMWNSFILHTLFLGAIVLKALHNGSCFMFRVVAAKHVQGKVDEASSYHSLAQDRDV